MLIFPTLKTGAAAQYPLDSSVRFQTQSVRFLDGSRQRYPLQGRPLRAWKITLDSLDDQELAAVIGFAAQTGSASFLFTDPVTGDTEIKCILDGDGFDTLSRGEMTAQANLIVREIV